MNESTSKLTIEEIDDIFDKIGSNEGEYKINLKNDRLNLKVKNLGNEKFVAQIYQSLYKMINDDIFKREELLWSSDKCYLTDNSDDIYYDSLSELLTHVNERLEYIEEF